MTTSLTKNAAAEYGAQGLRINCVDPAYIETPFARRPPAGAEAALVSKHPLGRLGQPDEVAPLVCFLLPRNRAARRLDSAPSPSVASVAWRGHSAQ